MLEVLVVDDCSTDGSNRVLEALACEDSRVRVVRHDRNMGVGATRNTILADARSNWIAFFDDDDESAPERLRCQYQRITQYEHRTGARLVLSYTARQQFFPDGTVNYEPTVGMDVTPGPSGEAMVDLILLGRPLPGDGGTCAACSQMARREVFEIVDGFDPLLRRGEDTDFNLRVALQGGHFAGLSAPLVTQHMTLTVDKRFDEERDNTLRWIANHRQYLERRSWYHFLVRWFDMKYSYMEGRKGIFLIGLAALTLRYPIKTLLRLYWSWPNRPQYRGLIKAINSSNNGRIQRQE